MSSYTGHVVFNMIVLSLMFIINQRYDIFGVDGSSIFLVFFVIGTFIVNPDMDTKSKGSNLIGVFSIPYRKVFKHRRVSHNWFYGIITRIVYFTVLMIVLGSLLLFVFKGEQIFSSGNIYYAVGVVIQFLVENKVNVVIAYMGLFLSNLLHILLDKIT